MSSKKKGVQALLQADKQPSKKALRALSKHDLVKLTRSLFSLATLDPLTSLDNRRRFKELAGAHLRRAQQSKKESAILMIDIDHFKKVNDTRGHDVGDQVLKKIAALIRKAVRPGDIVGRHGGEEFTVLLPEIWNPDIAFQVAERIRNIIQESRGRLPKVTVSIGVGLATATDYSFPTMMRRADQALYAAKKAGRNRVCI